ncbi:MAG: flagellar hook-associated protein FlgK, partial [Proteobacteria bacterium]|nr:flagellar hook-associated protein FlgK [Pseudomonadota bacterium]
MTITGVLNTALTGLFTTQSALRTTANNIVNVNTENYARQIVRLENIVVGGKSTGVRISDIERIVDRFLQSAGLDARSRAAAAATEDQFNQRFQGLLGRPDSQGTITARMGRLFAVIANLTINPSDQILRRASLSSLQDLGDEISRVSNVIQDLRNSANQQIQEQVALVNEALKRISDLNRLIVRQRAIGSETAGLQNRRDQVLNDLAGLIDIRISRNGDGAIGVATTSGVVLVDHGFRELEYNPPAVVTSETLFDSI